MRVFRDYLEIVCVGFSSRVNQAKLNNIPQMAEVELI